MLKIFGWLLHPEHFQDRRIQACTVVVFCMGTIIWSLLHPTPSPVIDRIVDWSFVTLMVTVGVYHAARGVDELSQQRTIRASVILPVETHREARDGRDGRDGRDA
jgi:hypothetical protein